MAEDKDRTDRVIKEIEDSMVKIPNGMFTMGSNEYDNETPVHKVNISEFRVSRYQVTQEQWETVMGGNPSDFKGRDLPVENVNWDDANKFIEKLNKLTKGGNLEYRLPTEAEWEYACRAHPTTPSTTYCFGNDESELVNYAWYDKNSESATHRVGLKRPNAWGLYDMHGNVWEWVADWYGEYPKGKATDPTGTTSGSACVLRGGSWNLGAQLARSADRHWREPDIRYKYGNSGFRLAASGKTRQAKGK
jgi:formylglycine-generating enzyme required for sulfatase activity